MAYQALTWFVTDGEGLIGKTIISMLRDADFQVIAFVSENSSDETITALQNTGAQVVLGTLDEPDEYNNYLAISDLVVHTFQWNNTTHKINKHAENTKNLIRTMMKIGLSRLIFISSGETYGFNYCEPINEDDITHPNTPWSKSMNSIEKFILDQKEKLHSTIVRPSFVIGNDDPVVLPFFNKYFRRKIIFSNWRKDALIGFTHVDDLANSILIIGTKEQTIFNIYNVQSFLLRISQIHEIGQRLYNRKIPIIPIPRWIRRLGHRFYRNSNLSEYSDGRIDFSLFICNFDLSVERLGTEIHWIPSQIKSSEFELLLHSIINHTEINDENDFIENLPNGLFASYE